MGLVSRMQIASDQGDLMRIITQLIGARHALEVGTFTGYSALCVARGLPDDGTLLCCDVSEEWTSIGRKYWEQAGVASKIDLRIGPALDTLSALPPGEQFDLAFIDADKPSYAAYFDEIIPRLRAERAAPRRQRALGRVGRRPAGGRRERPRDQGLQRQGRGRHAGRVGHPPDQRRHHRRPQALTSEASRSRRKRSGRRRRRFSSARPRSRRPARALRASRSVRSGRSHRRSATRGTSRSSSGCRPYTPPRRAPESARRRSGGGARR